MSHSINVAISEACQQAALKVKREELRAVKYTIDGESLVTDTEIPACGSAEQDFDALQDYLQPEQPAFIIARLEEDLQIPKYVMVIFIPPRCPIKPRTIFASSRVPVHNHFANVFTNLKNYFVDSIGEITFRQMRQQFVQDDSALSFEEREKIVESRQATVAAGALPQHDQFVWPCSDELHARLKTFAGGQGPRVVAGSAKEGGEGIDVGGVCESLDDLERKQPLYIAVRVDGKSVFVLYCPDTARPRQKMVSSTCKYSFIRACEDDGVTFEAQFDIREESDLTDAHLNALINPEETNHGYGEVQIIQKPRRPGRR